MNPQEHRPLREALGPLALGQLAPEEEAVVRAHLDGCADCRAELAALEPVAGLLDTVDPASFATPPHPPVDLGERIRAAVAAERQAGRTAPAGALGEPPAGARPAGAGTATTGAGVVRLPRRAADAPRRRTRPALAAAAAVAVALGGVAIGRATAPQAQVPREVVALQEVRATPVEVVEAVLVPHTWGVELRMVAGGFAEGRTFRAAFRDARTGRLQPAGEFLGTGSATMTCNLQAAVLREDVSEVVVTDARGRVVLAAAL